MRAHEIMTTPAVAVDRNQSLEQAVQTMLLLHVGCLPVTGAKGELVGIVTEFDFNEKDKGLPFSLYRHPQVFSRWIGRDTIDKMYGEGRARQVKDIMTVHVETLAHDDSLEVVLERMLQTGCHYMPVLSKDGKPTGVISRHDLLKVMIKETEAEMAPMGGW